MGKYESELSPLAGLFQKNEHDVHDIHEIKEVNDKHEELEVYDEQEVQDVSDEQEEHDNKPIENSLIKGISTDKHDVYEDNVILTIAKLVNEVQKVQQEHDNHDVYEVQEVQYAQTYETTRGKKGKQLHRMNTGYTQPNWEFLVKESRRQGLRGGATELVNAIIDEYRIKKSKKNGA